MPYSQIRTVLCRIRVYRYTVNGAIANANVTKQTTKDAPVNRWLPLLLCMWKRRYVRKKKDASTFLLWGPYLANSDAKQWAWKV